MQKRRTNGSKLGIQGQKLESYFRSLYGGSFPKAIKDTLTKPQAFLQVPLGEAKFLEMLVRMLKPKKILEIGTFRGCSAVFMSKAQSKAGRLWTIERDQSRYGEIEGLWKKAGVSKSIKLIKNHALPALADLALQKMKFDFFFIDASKAETVEYFKICYGKLANKGALIVIDNTLWAGEVMEKDPKSNAARYMRDLNKFLFKKYKNQAYIFPGWDGLSIIFCK